MSGYCTPDASGVRSLVHQLSGEPAKPTLSHESLSECAAFTHRDSGLRGF